MKIKCPYCLVGFDNPTDLKAHIINMNHKSLAATKYVDILFKIHEKIEFLQKSIDGCEAHLKLTGDEIVLNTIQELKSLLNGDVGQ